MQSIKTNFLKFIILGICFLALTSISKSDDIILRNADSLRGLTTDETSIREFFGNVWLIQNDLDLKCDYAKQYLNSNTVDLIGNVVITQRTMILKSPKIFYNGNSGVAIADNGVALRDANSYLEAQKGTYSTKAYMADFYGDVFIEDDSVKIYSDNVVHNRTTRESFATGDVWIFGKYTNVVMKGDTIINIPKESYSISMGNTVLFKIDTIQRLDSIYVEQEEQFVSTYLMSLDTLSISCDTMQAYRYIGNEEYFFDGNVQIVKENIKAIAKSAVFYKNQNIIILRDKPIVWYDSTQLFSDSIVIELIDNKLKKLSAFGNSIAVTKLDSVDNERINQISANDIFIEFEDGKINSLRGNVNASSLYFFKDEEGYNGVDRKSTDSIHVEFINGEPENIFWIGSSVAEFYPENVIFGKITSYFLPEFKWSDIRPEIKKILFGRKEKTRQF
ncbi:MAG: LPS export ABC transporter periplasmic protein LptC [Candidatus Kapabacteria bacterium]|nr:LPS export ABC transporter periplasmic protein LptC [Candidatus Kapabacteria bacterium]